MADELTEPRSVKIAEQARESADKLRELRDTPPDKRGETFAKDLADATNEVRSLDAEFSTELRLEKFELERAAFEEAARQGGKPEVHGPEAAMADLSQRRAQTIGELYTSSEVYEQRQIGNGPQAGYETEVRNLLTGSDLGTSGSDAFVPVASPFLPPQGVRQRAMRLRDLFGSGQTGRPDSIPYIRELNPATNEGGASAVQEASAKPEVTIEFESADAPVRKIAAWVQATMEAYEDAPTLRSYVDNRLAYMVLVEEERQLLNGDGSAPNLTGIYNTSNIQTQAAVTDDLAATVGLAIANVENVDGMADGVAINPITFWTGLVERHANQMDGGVFSGPLPFGAAPPTLFGLNTVRTRAVAQNKAVVANWALGASVWDKTNGVTIRTTDSHASLFISNTLVVLAEERIAFPVFRPDFFVDATLSFT